eukprot:Clim_evm59s243 gene=Clim_evmTU59s243
MTEVTKNDPLPEEKPTSPALDEYEAPGPATDPVEVVLEDHRDDASEEDSEVNGKQIIHPKKEEETIDDSGMGTSHAHCTSTVSSTLDFYGTDDNATKSDISSAEDPVPRLDEATRESVLARMRETAEDERKIDLKNFAGPVPFVGGDGTATAKTDSSTEEEEPEEKTEEELKAEADAERALIVQKYREGRSKDKAVPIEDWEDPIFDVAARVDRYGFIRDEKIIDKDKTREELEEEATERRRSMKWVEMDRKWQQYKGSAKLKGRIYKGIPDSYRSAIWPRLLHIDIDAIREEKEMAGVYEDCLARAEKTSNDLHQIDIDIHRTFRNHVAYKDRYDVKQQQLFRVLSAYSVYNPTVGYCQGMSGLTAFLLMYIRNEDECFWVLHKLMQDPKYGLEGLYQPGFPRLFLTNDVLQKRIMHCDRRLGRHMEAHDLGMPMFTTKWFLTGYIDAVPFSLTLRLWDVFLLEGYQAMVSFGLGLMRQFSRDFRKENMEGMLENLLSFKGLIRNTGTEDAIMARTRNQMSKYDCNVPLGD